MNEAQSETLAEGKRFSFWGLIAGLFALAAAVCQIMSNVSFLYQTYTFKSWSAGLLTRTTDLRWLGECLYVPFHAVASLYAALAQVVFGRLPFLVPYELSAFSLTLLALVSLFIVVFLRFYGRPLRGVVFWALVASIVCLSLYALDGLINRSLSWTSVALIFIFISNYILMLLVMRYGTAPAAAPVDGQAKIINMASLAICSVFLLSTALIIFSVWYSYWRAGLLPLQ